MAHDTGELIHFLFSLVADLTIKIILTVKYTGSFYILISEVYADLCSLVFGLIFHTSIEEKQPLKAFSLKQILKMYALGKTSLRSSVF